MLDVHAPDHRISGFRDFMMHMLTITCGLLIALALENAAEALHHRHQRREAENNIRAEIRDNLEKVQSAAPTVVAERTNIEDLLKRCEARIAGKEVSLHGVNISFAEAAPRDAAWRTATANGVLSYMDDAEAGRFSDVYKEQDLLQTTEEKALDDFLEMQPVLSHHGEDFSVDQARDALPFVRHALAHLNGMLAVGAGTIGAYNDALK